MHKLYIHTVTVVAENLNLVLIYNIATVATDKVLTELVLDGLGGAAQHVIAEFSVRLITDLHVVVLRLHIVETVDADTHLETTRAINQVNQFGVVIVGLIIHHVHTDTVKQGALVAIDSLLQAYDLGHYDHKRQYSHGTSPYNEKLFGRCKIEKRGKSGIDERNHHDFGTYPRDQMYLI